MYGTIKHNSHLKCNVSLLLQGIVFTTSLSDIWNMREREDVQEKILDALSKFTHSGHANAGLGYMYFMYAPLVDTINLAI